jgi:SPP1 gp7 family putative phage head morphogenesis protein
MAKKETTVKKNTPTNLVINDFTQVSPDRSRKDIGKLRAAIERAESIFVPNRTALYDIYHDITTIDGHLSGIIRKRIDSVLNKSVRFVDGKGKKIDEMDTLIFSNRFNRLIELILESKIWGISGVEFIVGKDFNFEEIPRKHIRPEKGIITRSQYDNTGLEIAGLPYVWTIGDKKDLGLLLQCSMYALYKRSGFGDFAQYVEIFGQPVRIIYYDAYDTETKKQLRRILTESGGSLAMMIPKQAQFQMLDGKTSNGTGELQTRLINSCNAEMSIAILGNTETTTSSSSSGYAQAKEQGKQQMEIIKSDISFVQNTLNDPHFIDILRSYGFPVDGGAFEFEMELDMEALKSRLEIDRQVSQMVPVADDYWYETYGIPKPDNYDELKARQEEERRAAFTQEPPEPDETPDKKPKEKEETEITVKAKGKNALQALSDFFFGKNEVINLADYYDRTCPVCGGKHPVSLPDLADGATWENIYEDIARRLLDEKLKTGDIPDSLYFETARQLMAGVNNGLGGASFNYDDSRNVLKSYLTRNIYVFSAAKSLTEMLEFRNLMYDKKTGEMRSFGDFKQAVIAKGKVFNGAYLKTEYDTAIQSTIMAHKWDSMSAEYLEYSTVGDDRVRPKHAILDGLTYPKDHAIWNKMYPPLSWNCRCTVIPGEGSQYKPEREIADGKEVTRMVKGTIFDTNVGKTKLIFEEKHPYFRNTKGEIEELNYRNYGLKSLEKTLQSDFLKPENRLNEIADYEAFWNSITNHTQGAVFNDPLGQTVLFPDYDLRPDKNKGKQKNFFKQHLTTRKHDPDRWKIASNLVDVIKKPDEIWVERQRGGYFAGNVSTQYIKYYDKKAIMILSDKNEAKTMFTLEPGENTGFKTRHGILLYRK